MQTNPRPNKLSEILDARWYAFADLLCVSVACALWFISNGELGWWPLIIALLPWPARFLNGRFPLQRTPFDWLLLLFLITAVVSLWTTYDSQAAWSKFWLIAGAILLFYALAGQPPENIWPVWAALGVIGALIALYFLLSHDWSSSPVKFTALRTLQQSWMSIRPQLFLNSIRLIPNNAGGMIAMSAPALAASAIYAVRRQKWFLLAAVGLASAVLSAGLLLSASRGAWLSLLGGFLVWLLWAAGGKLSRTLSLTRRQIFFLLLAILVLTAVALIYLFPGGPSAIVPMLPGPNRINRLALNHDTMNLIRDYAITGAGLDSFPGQYSQYALITPVFFFDYAHNLYLDVALELGVPGLVILLAIAALTFWLLAGLEFANPLVEENELLYGSLLAGLTAVLLHGLVDNPLFSSRGLLLIFSFSGLSTAITIYKPSPVNVFGVRMPRSVILLSAVLLLGALSALLFRRPLLSSWHANLGAVAMTQVELDSSWPTNQWQGDTKVGQLAGAESRFHEALEFNNSNITALYRLGLIALARQDFDTAVGYLSAAQYVNPHHRGVQKALGYSALWNGDLLSAGELLFPLPESEYELGNYIGWWRQQGKPELGEQASKLLKSLQNQ